MLVVRSVIFVVRCRCLLVDAGWLAVGCYLLVVCMPFLRLLWVFVFGGWCGLLLLAYSFVVCGLLAFVVFVCVMFGRCLLTFSLSMFVSPLLLVVVRCCLSPLVVVGGHCASFVFVFVFFFVDRYVIFVGVSFV